MKVFKKKKKNYYIVIQTKNNEINLEWQNYFTYKELQNYKELENDEKILSGSTFEGKSLGLWSKF